MRVYESWLADQQGRDCLRLMAPGRMLVTVVPGQIDVADDLTPEEAHQVIRLLADAVGRYVLGARR